MHGRTTPHDIQRESAPIHPGITMHKIPVGADEIGLVFTLGVLAMILLALPEVRWFLALSLPTGVVIGIILRLIRRD